MTSTNALPSTEAHSPPPGPDLAADPAVARDVLRTMRTIRRFEEAVDQLFARGLLYGTMHLSIGQEAVPTGVCRLLGPTDKITSTHRGHGHCIAKGADLTRMMAELLGRDTGYCRGRGGSMHIADLAEGNLGANGIVAGGIPIAVGAALTQQLTATGGVVVSFFGDGALNEGDFHEAANMAAIWDLPVVFVCENNHYGMSMPVAQAFRLEHLAGRSAGYGFAGVTVDGNDVQAVFEAAAGAVGRARDGGGPTLLECVTYRHKGHSKSDRNVYRTRDEIAEWQRRDPIPFFEAAVTAAGTLDAGELRTIDEETSQAVRDAVVAARQAPEASADDLEKEVYAK
jgi:TPP-dependent pyruvate/acetoin dehydrogenase alpha subunit